LALDECAKLKQPELHVLGWEWEMGLYDLIIAEAKKKGVKLFLLQIPREVMEQQVIDIFGNDTSQAFDVEVR